MKTEEDSELISEGSKWFHESIILNIKEFLKESIWHCGLKILNLCPRVQLSDRVNKSFFLIQISLLKILKAMIRSAFFRRVERGVRARGLAREETLQ